MREFLPKVMIFSVLLTVTYGLNHEILSEEVKKENYDSFDYQCRIKCGDKPGVTCKKDPWDLEETDSVTCRCEDLLLDFHSKELGCRRGKPPCDDVHSTSIDCLYAEECIEGFCECPYDNGGDHCEYVGNDTCNEQIPQCIASGGRCKSFAIPVGVYCDCGNKTFYRGKCAENCTADTNCKYGEKCIDNLCTCPDDVGGELCNFVEDSRCLEEFPNCMTSGGICKYSEDKNRFCDCRSKIFQHESGFCVEELCKNSPCQNGGICKVNKHNETECYCKRPYSGKHCEKEDKCLMKCGDAPSVECTGDIFSDAVNCSCKDNFTFVSKIIGCRKHCEKKEDCKYGETCQDRLCLCDNENKGSKCEKISNEDCVGKMPSCSKSGGSCEYTENGRITCNCMKKEFDVTSKTCKDPCSQNPCKNGGNCTMNDGKRICECTSSYTGADCEIEIDKCILKYRQNTCNKLHEICNQNGECECEKHYKYSEDKKKCIAVEKPTCKDIRMRKLCGKTGAICVENMPNMTESYQCVCAKDHDKENGICTRKCEIERNVKQCSDMNAICSLDDNYNVECECPPLFTREEEEGPCNIIAEHSYLGNLRILKNKYKLEQINDSFKISTERIDMRKLSIDVKESVKNVYGSNETVKILKCSESSFDLISCSIEIQFNNIPEDTNKILRSSVCLPLDAEYCWLKPNLIVKREEKKDFLMPTDPCNEAVSSLLCGSETYCKSNKYKNFQCLCKDGFETIGINERFNRSETFIEKCKDINECEGKSACPSTSYCVNTYGSYNCHCKEGFKPRNPDSDLKLEECIDIDECEKPSACPSTTQCQNTFGSYICICKPGFEKRNAYSNPEIDGCKDINECNNKSACPVGSYCVNTRGSFKCYCKDGFKQRDSFSDPKFKGCTDIDECEDIYACPSTTECRNTYGSYICVCKYGFQPKSKTLDPRYNGCKAIPDSLIVPVTYDPQTVSVSHSTRTGITTMILGGLLGVLVLIFIITIGIILFKKVKKSKGKNGTVYSNRQTCFPAGTTGLGSSTVVLTERST